MVVTHALLVGVVGVGTSGCDTPETLIFEEPTECTVEAFPPGAETCWRPSGCCDVGSDGLAAICAEYFTDLPTPVMCDVGTLPAGYACASPTSEDFDCGWRASRLVCCKVH